ncbi:nuclear pore complex protein NUP54 [Malania oleifera]|uniref:nuclear pore complex protein NUP54 n=1 Tax=Malania oleifera TaxID=397392 RepID=UPI0025AE3480|nr:nuclear pore complex protein NUP54 [Malania oleifera]
MNPKSQTGSSNIEAVKRRFSEDWRRLERITQRASKVQNPEKWRPRHNPRSQPSESSSSAATMFGAQAPSSAFGTPSSTPAFGTPSSTPAFGTPSTPSFATGFGSSLFSTPFSQQQQPQQQQQTPSFQQPSAGGFGSQTPFAAPPQSSLFAQSTPLSLPNAQLTTQMAPVAPLPFSLADRDIQAIVDAYKDEPGNPKYAFKHLLFSVTEPQYRVKPAGVSDIMWAEAMGKLEGMESSNRERLWPQLVQGFKDLSQRLKLQDEVFLSDAERLRMTQSNVKLLQRHFQADTLPWIQRMRQKEQGLQRRLLRVMRIVEALENKGYRLPLMKGEAELAEKLAAITRQLKGSGAELSKRVQNLLTVYRFHAGAIGGGSSVYLPGSTKIHEQSLTDMQEVLQQQTEAIARLGNVLKRDIRDMEIIMSEDIEMREDAS